MHGGKIISDLPHIRENGRNNNNRGQVSEAEQNRLILENMRLVPAIVQKFRGGKFEFEELMAVGRDGLVSAARTFNPTMGEFPPRAGALIESAIMHFVRSNTSQWFPKDDDPPLPPLDGDKIEKIYEWDSWGDFGNSMAISENWLTAGASPEDIAIAFSHVRHRQERFAAAFISLTSIQRKMVRAVYLQDPPQTVESAAREIGISRWRASRSLKKALVVMRDVIQRIEENERRCGERG